MKEMKIGEKCIRNICELLNESRSLEIEYKGSEVGSMNASRYQLQCGLTIGYERVLRTLKLNSNYSTFLEIRKIMIEVLK